MTPLRREVNHAQQHFESLVIAWLIIWKPWNFSASFQKALNHNSLFMYHNLYQSLWSKSLVKF